MVIEYKKEGRIALFTINHPPVNAMDMQSMRQFSQAMADFRDDPELWVGIITGAGDRAFSAGADIKDTVPFMKESLSSRPWAVPVNPMRGMDIWKPLIAAINGFALGGGMEIVLACDIRIAAENATLGTPEVAIGLMPGWGGTQRLPRMVPWCKAAEILLLGKPIDAQEAYRIGLVNKVVPRERLMSTAREWAEVICQQGPLGVRAAKEAMTRGSNMTLDDGLRLENALEAYLINTDDYFEGVSAFLEKRKPDFKAK